MYVYVVWYVVKCSSNNVIQFFFVSLKSNWSENG